MPSAELKLEPRHLGCYRQKNRGNVWALPLFPSGAVSRFIAIISRGSRIILSPSEIRAERGYLIAQIERVHSAGGDSLLSVPKTRGQNSHDLRLRTARDLSSTMPIFTGSERPHEILILTVLFFLCFTTLTPYFRDKVKPWGDFRQMRRTRPGEELPRGGRVKWSSFVPAAGGRGRAVVRSVYAGRLSRLPKRPIGAPVMEAYLLFLRK